MPDNEIIAAMVEAERDEVARQTEAAEKNVLRFDHHKINQAALRAALETAGVTEAMVEFAMEKWPGVKERGLFCVSPEEAVLFDTIRAAYGKE